jgi:asparagine synthase (glutamine-hydrolysing)
MCGIFGYYAKRISSLSADLTALNLLKHRGPDNTGYYKKESLFSGHTRLSILDTSFHGNQPFISPCKKIILTINGEIYNFKSLIKKLSKDVKLRSASDSEVLLYYYLQFGLSKTLNDIEGMYAFTIVDLRSNNIFLCRDRFGVKPLFYHHNEDSIYWSSEAKSILSHKGIDNFKKRYESIYDYLTYLYVPTPYTLYEDIFKLEPGSYIKYNIDNNSKLIVNYYTLYDKINNFDSINETCPSLYELIDESIQEQLVADVPLGTLLSGGVDSSIITHHSSKYINELYSFNLYFNVDSHNESKYAKNVSMLCNTIHSEFELNHSDIDKYFDFITRSFDEPLGDSSVYPTFFISKFASNTCKVLLSGDGADEIFGGYNYYSRFLSENSDMEDSSNSIYLNCKNSFVRKLINKLQCRYLTGFDLFAKLKGGLIRSEKSFYRKLFEIPIDYDDYWYFKKYYRTSIPIYKRFRYLDISTYLHDDILTKVDRMSMLNSVEVRVPFIKSKIVENAFKLKNDDIFTNGILKYKLKSSYKNIFDNNILFRSKRGFSTPFTKLNKSTKAKDLLSNKVLSYFHN